MSLFRVKYTILSVLAGMFLGLLVFGFFFFSTIAAPPTIISAASSYGHVVYPGGMVMVDMTATKSRECITQTTRWLWRDIGGRREVVELSYAAMSFGHDTPPLARDYRLMFEVPVGLPPGEWNVRALHADYCWPWSWVLGPRLRPSPPTGLLVVQK